ncbi:11191_t:CDS:2, partial [Cetraspora pellucida]
LIQWYPSGIIRICIPGHKNLSKKCYENSQEQLRRFKLVGEEYPKEFRSIISALESQKLSSRKVKI